MGVKSRTRPDVVSFAATAFDATPSENGIEGVVVCEVGEARGWKLWADVETCRQVVKQGNAAPKGVKVRLGHVPSAAGPTGFLGWARKFRLDGEKVRADLTFADAARKNPAGDLAEYVSALATEAAETFGLSAVMELDFGAMDRFMTENEDVEGDFVSPDRANEENYPHIRLAGLAAVDVVNDPGLTENLYAARGVAAEIKEVGEMAKETKTVEMSAVEFGEKNPDAVEKWKKEGAAGEMARLSALREAYADDPEFVLVQFAAGKTAEACKGDYWQKKAEAAEAERARLSAELEAARKTPAAPQVPGVEGEREPAGGNAPAEGGASLQAQLMAAANEKATKEKIPFAEALEAVAGEARFANLSLTGFAGK